METNQNNLPVKQNYYTSKKSKVVDFSVGFLFYIIYYLCFFLLFQPMRESNYWFFIDPIFIFGNGGFAFLLAFLSLPPILAFAKKKKRKFIVYGAVIGALFPFLILLLAAGSCFLMIGRYL